MDLSLSGYLLPAAIAGIAIAVIIIVAMIRRISQKPINLRTGKEASAPSRHPLDYQPVLKTIPAIQPTPPSGPGNGTADIPRPKRIDLTSTRGDMTESFAALARKYSLDTFTIATADGLLLGSSGGGNAIADAATYSGIFRNDPREKRPGVYLFGLRHKGSDLVGIIRTGALLKNDVIQQIAADTQVVLNRWI